MEKIIFKYVFIFPSSFYILNVNYETLKHHGTTNNVWSVMNTS